MAVALVRDSFQYFFRLFFAFYADVVHQARGEVHIAFDAGLLKLTPERAAHAQRLRPTTIDGNHDEELRRLLAEESDYA
jgi:hypothetical protein